MATRDPLGRTTTQQWCTCGSLDKLIDANGNATTWERDLQGRVTREIRADGSTVDFAYENTTSRLKQVTDAKSQVVGYEYFADNNLKQITYTNAAEPDAEREFHLRSELQPARDDDGRDGDDDLHLQPRDHAADSRRRALGERRWPAGQRHHHLYVRRAGPVERVGSSTAWPRPKPTTLLEAVESEVTPIGTFSYAYVGVTGRLSSVTYPNGQTTDYAYLGNTGDHRLQEIHNKLSGGATLSRFQYTYDGEGTIKTWTQQAGANPAQGVRASATTRADQLTSATLKTTDPTPAILKRYGYDYDKAGNRTTEQIDDSAMAADLQQHEPASQPAARGSP